MDTGERDSDPPDAVPLTSQSEESGSVLRHSDDLKVPITLITGFLGAGKTTLVQHILTQPHGFKIAVILNDFGDSLGIDKALLSANTPSTRDSNGDAAEAGTVAGEPRESGGQVEKGIVEEWVEVGNGCICCNVKHSFVLALEQLLQRRDRFDYIVLETTGLANPGPVIGVLWTDDELESPLRLDSVVTVVDGANILRQLEQDKDGTGTKLAQVQIAYADTVVVNKVDLLPPDPAALGRIDLHIRSINACARIVHTQRCAVDVGHILNTSLFDSQVLESAGERVPLPPGTSFHPLALDIGTTHFSLPGRVHLPKVEAWLAGLLWEKQGAMDILRMKGALHVAGRDEVHVFQAVRELFEVTRGRPAAGESEGESLNRVLVVGYRLDEALLKEGFQNCLDA